MILFRRHLLLCVWLKLLDFGFLSETIFFLINLGDIGLLLISNYWHYCCCYSVCFVFFFFLFLTGRLVSGENNKCLQCICIWYLYLVN